MPEVAWASGDRSTHAFLDNGALTIVRSGHALRVTTGHGCYARPSRLVFTDDGREVYVATAGAVCRIDTTTGASFVAELGPTTPTTRWVFGGLTGWLYRLQSRAHDTVTDPIGSRSAPLPIRVDSSACDLIEIANRALVACDEAQAIEISELDTSQFPPALVRTRRIAVAGPSAMRFSRDGKFLAVWNQPQLNHPALARVFDLDALFEVARIRSRFPIVAIDVRGSELALLEEPAYGRGELVVSTFQGLEHHRWPFQAVTLDVYWLTDGRILATGFDGSAMFQP